MIKINNFIFNENSVMQIDKCCGGLTIQVENGSIHIDDATFSFPCLHIKCPLGFPFDSQSK